MPDRLPHISPEFSGLAAITSVKRTGFAAVQQNWRTAARQVKPGWAARSPAPGWEYTSDGGDKRKQRNRRRFNEPRVQAEEAHPAVWWAAEHLRHGTR